MGRTKPIKRLNERKEAIERYQYSIKKKRYDGMMLTKSEIIYLKRLHKNIYVE